MPLSAVPTLLAIPPISLLLAACAGALLSRRRFGRPLLILSLAGLLLLALPLVAGGLTEWLEAGIAPPGAEPAPPPQAVVILSGDEQRVRLAGGGAGWRVGPLTLERVAAGAALARRTRLPVLVAGGVIADGAPSLAAQMALSLEQDFATPVRWREDASLTTWENAARSAAILRPLGITRIYLVTHAWHMRRALLAFRRAGLDPVAVPVQLDAMPSPGIGALVPSARAWLQSTYAVHELIGWAWYALHP